jgi:hypothetical protein
VIPPPAPVRIDPPRIDRTEVARRLRAVAQDLSCADVRVETRGESLTVRGFVASPGDADRLRAAAAADVVFDLPVRPWPQCEALLTLSHPLEQARGLVLSSGKAEWREGEPLVMRLTTPAYPSYLYVSYIQADGQVVHLRRYADQGNQPLPPGTALTLGGKGEYVISGPVFGDESVVAVASRLPLMALDRPPAETEREYLTELRLALLGQQQGKAQVEAVFLPLVTAAAGKGK